MENAFENFMQNLISSKLDPKEALANLIKVNPLSFKNTMDLMKASTEDIQKYYPEYDPKMLEDVTTEQRQLWEDYQAKMQKIDEDYKREMSRPPKNKWEKFQRWVPTVDEENLKTIEEMTMYYAHLYFGDTLNGGHLQFFFNKHGWWNFNEIAKLFKNILPENAYKNFIEALDIYNKTKSTIDYSDNTIEYFSKVGCESPNPYEEQDDFYMINEYKNQIETDNAIKAYVKKYFK